MDPVVAEAYCGNIGINIICLAPSAINFSRTSNIEGVPYLAYQANSYPRAFLFQDDDLESFGQIIAIKEEGTVFCPYFQRMRVRVF